MTRGGLNAEEQTKGNLRDIQQDHDALTNDHLAPHEQPHKDRGMAQNSEQLDPTQAKAAELAVESENEELAAAFLI